MKNRPLLPPTTMLRLVTPPPCPRGGGASRLHSPATPFHPLLACCMLLISCSLPLSCAIAQDRIRQATAKMSLVNPDEPVTITAQRQNMDNRTGIWTGSGGVTISNSTIVVSADKMTLDQQTGDVEALGNVRMIRPGMAEWRGEHLTFNYRSGTGLAEGNIVTVGRFTIHARELGHTTESGIIFKDVSLTTCTNAPGLWHWHMNTGEVKYRPDKSISAWHGSIWFFGVPVAYVPYFYRDLETHYGFRLLPGYTSDWGLFGLGRYVYPYLHGPDWLQLTGQTRFDLRSKRGAAVGHDFKWDFGTFGQGNLELYYAHDHHPERLRYFPDRHARNDRTRINFTHEANITPVDRLFIKAQDLSDPEFLREFFEPQYRKSMQPDNVASYTHREADAAVGLTFSGPIDNFYDGIRHLPEVWLNIMPQPLLPGLYYESQSRTGYLRKRTAPRAADIIPRRGPEYSAFRADTHQRLSMPLWLGIVRLVPRAAWHGTYYNHSWVDNSGHLRSLFELGAEASIRAHGSLGSYRHVVEPYLDYSWIPRSDNLRDGENYVFNRPDSGLVWRDWFGLDGIPMWRQWHGLRFGLRNALQSREADRTQRTILESDLYGAYTFGTQGDPEGVRILGTTLRTAPHKNVRLHFAGEYDPKDNEIRTVDSRITLLRPRWELTVGDFYSRDIVLDSFGFWNRDPTAHLLYAEASVTLNSVWAVGTHFRYECRQSRLQEITGFIKYSLDCMSLQARIGYEPKYTDINGRDEKANFKIGFAVSLHGLENKFKLDDDGNEFQF
ncbi:MAG: LPS assembly protein LptD [Lentisphaerae bacterium]|nr:LPS assembly protein LptD [Lentisphaerota bacterium]